MGRAPPPVPSPRERPATDLHALPQLGPRRREASAPAGSPACPPLSSWKRPLPCPCPLPLALVPQETGLEKGLTFWTSHSLAGAEPGLEATFPQPTPHLTSPLHPSGTSPPKSTNIFRGLTPGPSCSVSKTSPSESVLPDSLIYFTPCYCHSRPSRSRAAWVAVRRGGKGNETQRDPHNLGVRILAPPLRSCDSKRVAMPPQASASLVQMTAF